MITQIKSQNIQSILPFFVIDYEGNIIEARNVTSIGIQSKKLPVHVGSIFCEKNTEILLETILDFKEKKKKSFQVELEINHHSKATWYLFTCTKHQIETKDCVYVTIQNIHSYKQQILQLQTSLNKQKKELQRVKQISDFNAAVINNANAIIVALDKNGTILKFSKNAEKISGYAKKEIIGKNIVDVFVPKSEFPNENKAFNKFIQNKGHLSFYETPFKTKNGVVKIISWENRTVTNQNSDIAFVCIGKDITELRQDAQKLTDSESRFRELAKTLPLAIICVDRSGNILFMNQAYTQLFGYSATELTSVSDIIHAFYESKEIIKKAKLRWQKDLSNDYHKPIQTRTIHVRCKNGQYKDIEVNGALNNQNLYYSYTDITYRLQYEKDLIEGKEYFKKVAENTPVPVAIGNLKMETVFVNKAFTKVLGYTIDDIPKVQSSNPYFVFNNEEESKLLTQEWFEIAEAYIHTGQLLKQTIYRSINCKNGQIKHFEISFSIEDKLLYSIFIDITDKRKVQELLLESEQKFKKVAENIPLPMVCYTKQMEFIFTNQQFTKLFGLNMSNLDTYAHWLSRFVYPNTQVEAKELQELASAIEGFQTNTQTITPIFERSIKDANDEVRVFELAFTVQEDLVYMILNDVSEKIETKKLLQKSEYRFRNIAENAPLAILTFDEEMNITYVNEQFKNILGYSLEDVTENGVWQKFIVHTNDAERLHSEREWKTSIERLRTRKLHQAESLERTIVCKNGENRIFEISFTADDQLVYAILDDITERKTSEQRLFESEQRFKALADNLPIAIGSHHVDGTILFLNNHFVKTIGYTLEEIPTLEEWYLRTQPNPDIRATLFAHWLETVEAYKKNQFTEAPHIETDIRCKNKTTRTFNFLFSIHQDIVYILFVDITERKKAEKELISSHFQLRELTSHLQKVREEERKFIAREIHDELGQLITGLKMDISMLKKRLISKIPDVGNYMVDVLELTDTIVQTVRRIASDLRPGILDDVGLGAALEWQAKEFEKRTTIKCVFDNGIDDLDLSVDIKSNIFRIYQESLTNIIRHSNATIVKSAAHVIQKKLVLTIQDNGRGFDTNVANKTLGILGMKERAIMINATFTIESKTDAGTAITLKMPLN